MAKLPGAYNNLYLWRICLISTFGGLLFGYDWVVIGGAKPFYELYFNITSDALKGWAMSSALVGCIFGSVVSGMLSDPFGRKKVLVLTAVLFIISALGTGLVNHFSLFIAFRLLGGIGIGLASNLSPLYIAEVSPASIRGRMVSVNQLAIVFGVVVAQIVNWVIARNLPSGLTPGEILISWYGQFGWRWMFAAEGLPALLFLCFMFLVPESPRWLVQNNKEPEASIILEKIGGAQHAQTEVAEIQRTKQQGEKTAIKELLHPKMLWIVFIGIVLAVFQQACGINVIFYYSAEIFKEAGIELSGIWMTIVTTGIVLFLFTFISFFAVDRFGRKPLMLIGSFGLFIIHAAIALSFMFDSKGMHVLILILAAIAFYAFSLAPVTWVLLAELFPTRIRGAAMSIAVFSLWVTCTAVAQWFPVLKSAVGAAGSFWTFSVICLAGGLFCLKFLPETKGKSLEELERVLLKNEPLKKESGAKSEDLENTDTPLKAFT